MNTPEALLQEIGTIRERVSPEVASVLEALVGMLRVALTALARHDDVLGIMLSGSIATLTEAGVLPVAGDDA